MIHMSFYRHDHSILFFLKRVANCLNDGDMLKLNHPTLKEGGVVQGSVVMKKLNLGLPFQGFLHRLQHQ